MFHENAVPTCTSTVFSGSVSAPEAPENFAVNSGGGMTLNFSWDHSDISDTNLSLSLSGAQEARARARSLTAGQTHITSALRNLEVGEAEAYMMIRRINAGARAGSLNYTVIAVFGNGSTRELVSTTSDSASYTLSLGDAAAIQSFHVVASTSGGTSEPSNSVPNAGFVELPDEIPVPDMAGLGWTRNQAEMWGQENGVPVMFDSEYSDTILEHLITRTNPTESVVPGQALRVFISRGPEPELPPVPPLPPFPDPGGDPTDEPTDEPTEVPVGPGDEIDSDNVDPFDINPGLGDVINVGNFSQEETGSVGMIFAAILERFKGIVH